jgi:HYR domain/Bacterial Ig domain
MQNHAKRRFNNTNVNVMAAIAIGAMLIFSVAGIQAFAQDKVVNDIDASASSVTITAGQTTQVSYKIIAQKESTDPNKGPPDCNPELDPVTIALNIPTGVTANPTSLDFNQCNVFKDVDFTSTVPGTYTIRVQDAGTEYDEAPATFTLIVNPATPSDTTAPTLNLPDDITKEATGPIAVTYEATATDNGQNVPITCTPASGSTFPLGTTTVNCSAKDAAGNEAKGSFKVTVTKPADETKPTISITSPNTGDILTTDSVTVEVNAADSGSGIDKVEVQLNGGPWNTATSTGTDTWSYKVTNLVEGSNTITAKATDKATNPNSDTASVTVTYTPPDTTPPTLKVPTTPVIAEATGPNGAPVQFEVTASDTKDGDLTDKVVCKVGENEVKSGSTFPLGTTTVTCSATDAAGNTGSGEFKVTVKDTTPPVVTTPADITAEATGLNGAEVTYDAATANDLVDGTLTATCDHASGSVFPLTTFPSTTTTVTCSATDAAGNTGTGTFKVTVQDTTKPVIKVTSLISAGQEFYFGNVPTAPTCTATDSGSGVNNDGCKVTGYFTTVGPQTLTFTATDKAGNTETQTIKYTVLPWTINGFYQPVDMNNVVNTVKGGSTVPLKFEVFSGGTELTATSVVNQPLTAKKISCTTGAEDAIETLSPTGSTNLRYDATAGQFIYNWQTPKAPNTCYQVTVVTQDGTAIVALFKLK